MMNFITVLWENDEEEFQFIRRRECLCEYVCELWADQPLGCCTESQGRDEKEQNIWLCEQAGVPRGWERNELMWLKRAGRCTRTNHRQWRVCCCVETDVIMRVQCVPDSENDLIKYWLQSVSGWIPSERKQICTAASSVGVLCIVSYCMAVWFVIVVHSRS